MEDEKEEFEYYISFPNYMKNDLKTYNFIIDEVNKSTTFYDKIVLDFSSCKFIEGNLLSYIGSTIDYLTSKSKKLYRNNDIPDNIKGFFKKNLFSTKLNLKTEGNYDYYHSTVKYKEFSKEEEEEFSIYIYDELLNHKNICKFSETLKDKIHESVFEVYENARYHGKTEKIFTCGQYFPRKKKLYFTITNLGITIKENIESFLKKNNDKSIEWALKNTNSTKDIPGGIGLPLLREFIFQNDGEFQIISDDEYYCEVNGTGKTYHLNNSFPGTIITLIININDTEYIYNKEDQCIFKI